MSQHRSAWRWLLYCSAIIVGIWLLLPITVVLPLGLTESRSLEFPPSGYSFRWYENFFQDRRWVGSLAQSLSVASITTVIALVLGVTSAFAISRGTFKGKTAIQGLALAPIIIPVVSLGVGIYSVYLSWGIIGSLAGFVAAHAILATPYVLITTLVALQSFDSNLELAAKTLGASPLATFMRVTVPGILPGLLAGALFAFVISFDETVVSLFIQGPQMRTLPVQMFTSVTNEVDPTMAAVSSLLVIIITVAVTTAIVFRRGNRA